VHFREAFQVLGEAIAGGSVVETGLQQRPSLGGLEQPPGPALAPEEEGCCSSPGSGRLMPLPGAAHSRLCRGSGALAAVPSPWVTELQRW